MTRTNIRKVYDSLGSLIKELKKSEKQINILRKRIDFLEGKKYGEYLINNGIEKTILNVLRLLNKFPRQDNIMYNGSLTSTDLVIRSEIMALKERLKKKD